MPSVPPRRPGSAPPPHCPGCCWRPRPSSCCSPAHGTRWAGSSARSPWCGPSTAPSTAGSPTAWRTTSPAPTSPTGSWRAWAPSCSRGSSDCSCSTRPVTSCRDAGARRRSRSSARPSRCRPCCCSRPTPSSSPPGSRCGSTEVVPFPWSDAAAEAMLRGAQVLTLGSIVAAVGLVWARHRQASAPERTQLRWLLWAGIMCVLMVLAAVTLSVGGVVTTVLLDLAVASLAVSVAVGLVRPGLGDVDALVAWTLTTAVVAAIVVGIDLAVLAAGTALLGDRLDQRDVTLVVLVLAVVVYGPLRGWLGGLVHRLLLGRRNDRYGAVSALAARLETIGTVDEQLPALASAVADTFKVRHVRVEVLTPDGGLLSASHGTPPAEVQEIDIAYQDERVGRLVLPVQGYRSMLSRRDQGLLVDLVRQAAVAIRAAPARHRAAGQPRAPRARPRGRPPPDPPRPARRPRPGPRRGRAAPAGRRQRHRHRPRTRPRARRTGAHRGERRPRRRTPPRARPAPARARRPRAGGRGPAAGRPGALGGRRGRRRPTARRVCRRPWRSRPTGSCRRRSPTW